MAAPAITGAISLLYQAVPKVARRLDCVIKILKQTANRQKDTECGSPQPVPNYSYGFGTINIHRAVRYARQEGCK
jgi:hypothetical protein